MLGFEIDRNDVMWILDQGHIAGGPSGPGDEKLIGWDLKTGKEVARYEFSDADSDKKCSFINDVAGLFFTRQARCTLPGLHP